MINTRFDANAYMYAFDEIKLYQFIIRYSLIKSSINLLYRWK